MKQYANRNVIAQGDYYMRHVKAMTAEGLHNKGDIAAELAHRDQLIDELNSARADLVIAVHGLASNFENAMPTKDFEAARKAEGDIAHALKIAAKYNWNGNKVTI